MGRINKALNRSNYKQAKPGYQGNNTFHTKRQQDFQQREQAREDKRELKLIELDEDQQNRKDLKFVYDLPQTVKDVKKLLKGANDEDKLVIISRIRDFYNPILEPQHTEKFKSFVLCLLLYYLQKDTEAQTVRQHLQELCSQFGVLFSAFLKSKLQKVLLVVKELRDNKDLLQSSHLEELDSLLKQVKECQTVVIRILECPSNSKLIEILEQTVGHIYSMSKLFIPSHTDLLLELIDNDIKICGKLHKKFNPALTLILVTLLNYPSLHSRVKDLTELHLSKTLSQLPAAQVLTCELHKALHAGGHRLIKKDSLLVKRDHELGLTHSVPLSTAPYLEPLRLQAKKPKELPSFNPMIDEDFLAALMEDGKKYKKKEDEKEVKRKTKKAEKDALRELRKDTVQIQVQKEKEQRERKQIFMKSVIRGGNVKDDA